MALSFLKTGAASAQVAQQEQAAYEARKQDQDKAFRFFMKEGEKGVFLTFVDGELDSEHGVLLPPRCYEHTVKFQGKWINVVCPTQNDPQSKEVCPLCEEGDRPALVSFFTVIDHRTYTSAKGNNYSNTRKLFVAKPNTMEELNAIAIKRGGLAGCRFEVRRIGEKSAGVGSHFDFEEKRDIAELQQHYTETVKDEKTNKEYTQTIFLPLNYEGEELIFRTGDELRKMGLGNPAIKAASAALSPGGNGAQLPKADYSKAF